MNQITTSSQYVHPYPQPLLDGDLGLTSWEIAKALNVKHDHVLKKIRRINRFSWETLGWKVVPNVEPFDITNQSVKVLKRGYSFVLNVDAAKVFVARWNNEAGDQYMRYLLMCEKLAESKFCKVTKRKTAIGSIVSVTKLVTEQTLFGLETYAIEEKKHYHALSPAELHQYKIKHRQASLDGITREQTKALISSHGLFLLPDKLN